MKLRYRNLGDGCGVMLCVCILLDTYSGVFVNPGVSEVEQPGAASFKHMEAHPQQHF